jgi:N-acetylglucosaminyldiphosphoundecaprenol N-acetyl-beta-D-mannosaminyltransferase
VVASISPTHAVLTRNRVELLGTPVDRVPLDTVGNWITELIESGTPHQIVTANLDFVAIARKRPAFAEVIRSADLVLCDGKPLQWAAHMQGYPIPSRVTGMDLVLRTAMLSAGGAGYRIFLLGGAPGIAKRAAAELNALFPGAHIAGCCTPPQGEFSEEENAHIIELIRAARTDALFVALGAPRQDEWIYEHLDDLGVPLCAGIGGVFNFLAGVTKRAPDWMQRAGLEWAFRLGQEPQRLWKRYLVNDLPIFLELLARQAATRLTRKSTQPAALR